MAIWVVVGIGISRPSISIDSPERISVGLTSVRRERSAREVDGG